MGSHGHLVGIYVTEIGGVKSRSKWTFGVLVEDDEEEAEEVYSLVLL